jgi:hypothetical protein
MPKTLKRRLVKYLCKQKDICCEADYDRAVVIRQILDMYKTYYTNEGQPEEYLNWINNDLLGIVGYRSKLRKNNDSRGVRLWDELNNEMLTNDQVDIDKVVSLLESVPLYFLLAFLGSAYYRFNRKRPTPIPSS